MKQIALSVVIPIFNEEQGLPELYRRLVSAVESITQCVCTREEIRIHSVYTEHTCSK